MIITNNIYSYILICLLILSFTLNPILKKTASKNVNSNEFLIIYHFIASAMILVYIGYQIYNEKCSIYCFKKLNKNDYIYTVLACITGIAGSLLLLHLIKIEEISYIMPNVQGIVIAIGAILGYYMYNETMDKYKIGGVVCIIVGVIAINYSKLKYTKML